MNVVARNAYFVPRMHPLSPRRSSIVSVVDLGSTKTVCLIARLKPVPAGDQLPRRSHSVEVIGYGYQKSLGIKSGVIADIDAAEQSIRQAVDCAERQAGITIESVLVATNAGRLSSKTFAATVQLDGDEVTESDITRVLGAGSAHAAEQDRAVLHAMPIGYSLDGNRGIDDPRGLIAEKLSVDMHVVTADIAPLRNLELLINRGHLDVETIVAGPYCGGLAVLADNEADMGVAHIDIGGGTSSIAIFVDGNCVHVESVPVGGRHITVDIARALGVSFDTAERLKTLHGGTLASNGDDGEIISVDVENSASGQSDGELQVPRSLLIDIIKPRAEETLELLRDRVTASGYAGRIAGRVVLTGGASQLPGLVDLASGLLGRSVRHGRPLGIKGLPELARGPDFATAAGLLIHPQIADLDHAGKRQNGAASGNYVARFSRWLKESF